MLPELLLIFPTAIISVLVFVGAVRFFQDPERAEIDRTIKFVILQLIRKGYSPEKTLEIIQIYIDTK